MQTRDEVLGTSKQDFTSFASHLQTLSHTAATVVIGSETAFIQANTEIIKEEDKFETEPAFTD